MATTYNYAHGDNPVASGADLIVSPFIANYEPASSMNVSAEMHETVSLTGVDRIFNYTLDLSDSITLLNSFDVSGFHLDYSQGEEDINVAGLAVRVSNLTNFQSILEKAIRLAGDADEDVVANGARSEVHTYLEERLRNAIRTVFGLTDLSAATQWNNKLGGSMETAGISGDDDVVAANAGTPGTAGGAVDEAVGAATMSANATTELTGLTVNIDLSENAMAEACKTSHSASVASLFRQIYKATWQQYKDLSNNRLHTRALPMVKGQELAFAFDIDVATTRSIIDAGDLQNTSPESVPMATGGFPNAGSDTASYASMQMNLGNRRIVFKLKLTDGSGTFLVGDGPGLLTPYYPSPPAAGGGGAGGM